MEGDKSQQRWDVAPGDIKITLPPAAKRAMKKHLLGTGSAITLLRSLFHPGHDDQKVHGRKGDGDKESGKGGDTMSRYKREDGTWDPDRVRTVHEPILSGLREGVRPNPDGTPVVYMTGGGAGSGKSSILDEEGVFPGRGDAVFVDPDAIKGDIPEYGERASGDNPDPGAASYVHEESSYLAREGATDSLSAGYDVVYDTTGDGSIESLESKVESFREAGATRIEGNYAFAGSVEEAQRRADERASKPDANGNYRYVPPEYLEANHRDVSRTWQAAAERDTFDRQTLYSTAGPAGEPPTLIAVDEGGDTKVYDQAQYDAFIAIGQAK